MNIIKQIINFVLSQDEETFIPIETPTSPYTPPITGGEEFYLNPWVWVVIVGIITGIVAFMKIRNWSRKQETRTLDSVYPTLKDLDSSVLSLKSYLAVQGGIGITISVVCTISLIFVLVNPLITVLTCASSIFGSGYSRERAMNSYRADYKNRHNFEGYLRDRKGDKHRYNWSNIAFLNPYTPDEVMYMSLAAEVAKINAESIETESIDKDKILQLHKKIDVKKAELSKIEKKILKGKEVKPSEDINDSEKPSEDKKDTIFIPYNEDEREEMRKPFVREIAEMEAEVVLIGERIPKKIDLETLVPNPILIRNKYLVVIIAKGILKNRIDFVDWYDFDMFGEFKVPTAGPEMREVSTFHRVRPDPDDNNFRIDEYIPVFVSLFDDGHSRDALVPIEAIDMETNDILAAMAKAMGVERKHTAGEVNTSKALSGDLLNEERDFDLLADARSDIKALKIIDAEKKLKTLDKMLDFVTPPILVMIIIFIIGTIIGFLLGQNSILIK